MNRTLVCEFDLDFGGGDILGGEELIIYTFLVTGAVFMMGGCLTTVCVVVI